MPDWNFQRISENLTGTTNAFLICVSVHTERNGLVTVAELFGHTCHVGPIRAGSYTAARPLLIFRRVQRAPNHGSNHCNLPWCGSLPQL